MHTANLNQAIVDQYLRRDLLPDHIHTICGGYREKMLAMLKSLDGFPEGISFTRPQGGLFIWAELPEEMDTVKLLSEAVKKKVAYVPGTYFCVDGGHMNTLRLNFSNSTLEQIETGMETLKELIQSYR